MKEILRNPVRNSFLDPPQKILKTGIGNLVGRVSLIGLVGLVGSIGISFIGLVGLAGMPHCPRWPHHQMSLVGQISLISISGLIGHNGLVGIIGLIELSASSNYWPIGFISVIGLGLIASSASTASLAHQLNGCFANISPQL